MARGKAPQDNLVCQNRKVNGCGELFFSYCQRIQSASIEDLCVLQVPTNEGFKGVAARAKQANG